MHTQEHSGWATVWVGLRGLNTTAVVAWRSGWRVGFVASTNKVNQRRVRLVSK